ncbi:MAG TPA: hypothetical protein VGR05_09080 [Sphingomicrobium sp.]|nr:hypothetical protein [Sphingomicrobium sp.]
MVQTRTIAGVALVAVLAGGGLGSAAHSAPAKLLKMPDSETAVAMKAPALPARIVGDCPSSDPCEFGTSWRACEIIPVYREARAGAPLLRSLKADETFVAERAEMELTATGEVEMLGASIAEQTGGLVLAKGAKVAVYGPMPTSRILYFDPVSGKGWSPAAASDEFWRDGKLARLTRAPTITWWLKARLSDGSAGWLQLKSVPHLRNFPMFYSAEAMQSWDVNRTRDDESPDCGGMLEIKQLMAKE